MAGHDRVDLRGHLAGKVDRGAGRVDAVVVRRGGVRTAVVHIEHDRLDTASGQLGGGRVGGGDGVLGDEIGLVRRRADRGVRHSQPDEPDRISLAMIIDPADLVRRHDRLAVGVDDVRRLEVEVGAVEAAAGGIGEATVDTGRAEALALRHVVDQEAPGDVEFVVADAGELDAERVHHLDRRLVRMRVHLERPAGEVVPVGEEDRVRLAGADVLQMGAEIGGAADGDRLAVRAGDGAAVGDGRRAQVTVEVRHRHQLHRNGRRSLGVRFGLMSIGRGGRAEGGERQGSESGERLGAGQTAH